MKNDSTLIQGSVPRLLFGLSLPMALGLFFQLGVQTLDIWFLSKLGEDVLVAIGYIIPVSLLAIYLSIGLSSGASSLIGRKALVLSNPELKNLILNIQLLTLVIALALLCLGWVTIVPVFRWLGAEGQVLQLIQSYMAIFYLDMALTMVGMVALSSIRALGHTRVQGYSMCLVAVIHALLDPLLIFGGFGWEGLGMDGSAWAGAISKVLPVAVAFLWLFRRFGRLLIQGPVTRFRSTTKDLMAVAFPIIVNNAMIPLMSGLMLTLLVVYGDAAVAGFAIAVRIESLFLLVFNALSSVVGPLVGHNFSVRYLGRVSLGIKTATLFCLLAGILMCALLYLSAPFLAGLFTAESSVAVIAAQYLRFVSVSFGCLGVIMVVNAGFNGLGKPVTAGVISFLRVGLFFWPLALLGGYFLGVDGLFIAFSIANILCAVLALLWFLIFIRKERLRIADTESVRG